MAGKKIIIDEATYRRIMKVVRIVEQSPVNLVGKRRTIPPVGTGPSVTVSYDSGVGFTINVKCTIWTFGGIDGTVPIEVEREWIFDGVTGQEVVWVHVPAAILRTGPPYHQPRWWIWGETAPGSFSTDDDTIHDFMVHTTNADQQADFLLASVAINGATGDCGVANYASINRKSIVPVYLDREKVRYHEGTRALSVGEDAVTIPVSSNQQTVWRRNSDASLNLTYEGIFDYDVCEITTDADGRCIQLEETYDTTFLTRDSLNLSAGNGYTLWIERGRIIQAKANP